jgi:hypothetical protein
MKSKSKNEISKRKNSPKSTKTTDKELKKWLKEFIAEHDDVLRELAKR